MSHPQSGANPHLEAVYRRTRPDRIPFVPAIYDLKAALAGVPGHQFGLRADEMQAALDKEVFDLGVDAVTVGYDIYTVEAEALGAVVERSERLSMPEIAEPVLTSLSDVGTLVVPSEPSPRMRLLADMCADAVTRYDGVSVRCGMSGPFSVAAALYPRDRLLMDMMLDPAGIAELLRVCTEMVKVFCHAVAGTGADIVIFDSFISPPLLSPKQYEAVVQPLHGELVEFARGAGVEHVSLIAGGDTRPILSSLSRTGATSLLLDYAIDLAGAKEAVAAYPVPFRVNMPPELVAGGSTRDVADAVARTIDAFRDAEYWILGTGILPPDTPLENVRVIRETMES